MDAVDIWAKFYPEKYRVDADLIATNTVRCAQYLPEISFVRDDSFAFVKKSAEKKEHAHVSAIGCLELDTAFEVVDEVRASLVANGFETWQFGGDRRHFFPGCPTDCSTVKAFLEKCGFSVVGDPVYDVERDLVDYEPPCEPHSKARSCRGSDEEDLRTFFEREFPGRWKDDVMEKFSEDPSHVYGLFLDGACEGFAMTQLDGDAVRRAGAVWSADLGPMWGALGPIGVSKSLRGQGLGDALLSAALCSLRDQGARRTIIDWTVLTAFYGRHGFVPSHEFVTMRGDLL
ncbi:MAG TPA: GNAT family N-acetyltransferase [Fimbriimonadaceae bacterium]|nr:GNAT family N-acetyltransferase [Fimbriimonadaceae bacterium]